MNKSTLAIVVSIIASASVHAAEVYNKNGNKLDVYGKVKAMHYMSDYDSKDGDQSYVRFGFKGETQINDQLTGYGRWVWGDNQFWIVRSRLENPASLD